MIISIISPAWAFRVKRFYVFKKQDYVFALNQQEVKLSAVQAWESHRHFTRSDHSWNIKEDVARYDVTVGFIGAILRLRVAAYLNGSQWNFSLQPQTVVVTARLSHENPFILYLFTFMSTCPSVLHIKMAAVSTHGSSDVDLNTIKYNLRVSTLTEAFYFKSNVQRIIPHGK